MIFFDIENLKLANNWNYIFSDFKYKCKVYNDYYECLNYSYKISPVIDYCMSYFNNLFDINKAKAVFNWYKKHDSRDHSIEEYFDEYKHCTDETHLDFNSNYGLYAYSEEGLDKCIKRLANKQDTRQAMFCINNNEAMSDRSIDKLCTNTIQFFIRDNKLIMIVQMRASNLLTLLPYDSFMFCYWYFYVFNKLYNEYNMIDLQNDYIYITAATIHYYDKNLDNIETQNKDIEFIESLFDNYKDKDFLYNINEKMKQ